MVQQSLVSTVAPRKYGISPQELQHLNFDIINLDNSVSLGEKGDGSMTTWFAESAAYPQKS